MEAADNALSKLRLIRNQEASGTPGRSANCEALLSVLNGRVQVLIDHVRQLEDRVESMETMSEGSEGATGVELIEAGTVKIDHAARQVFVKGSEVPLSPTEYRLIHQLAANSGKVVLHRDLLRKASVHGDVNPGNLKVYIGRLRAKLNKASDAECDLKAVRGVGYRLTA